MGMVHAEIEIINLKDLIKAEEYLLDQDEIRRMHITVLVETGPWLLCINENIQSYLNLPFIEKRRFRAADDRIIEYDVVGPVELRYRGRKTPCNAFVLPGDSEPLLGAVPMEELDVIIHPLRQQLHSNTECHRYPTLKPI
jgi:clan AA aspartic protease